MKKILIGAIHFYQKHFSVGRGPVCRFVPTCSSYAIDAITEYGALRGTLMAIWRILRCNPFNKGGYDPVKPNKHKK